MAITVEKDGWKVSGDTPGELEAGIRALQSALSRASRISTPAQQLTPIATEPPRLRGRPRTRPRPLASRLETNKATAMAVLEALRRAGKVGLPAIELAVAVGANGLKGLGTPMSVTNKLIERTGLSVDDVYRRTFDPETRGKLYFPERGIDDAIARIANLNE